METKKRSLVKMISWRVVGIVFWPTVSYIITGDWVETSWLTGAFLFMTGMYYVHERFWDSIKWGKK
jgi:uncharacterized membrane protein